MGTALPHGHSPSCFAEWPGQVLWELELSWAAMSACLAGCDVLQMASPVGGLTVPQEQALPLWEKRYPKALQ